MKDYKNIFIKAIDKKPFKELEAPELGEGVRFYAWKMSAGERARFQSMMTKIDGKKIDINDKNVFNTFVNLCQYNLKDEKGKRIFDDSKKDKEILSNSDGALIERMGYEILDLNDMLDKDEEDDDEVKKAARN